MKTIYTKLLAMFILLFLVGCDKDDDTIKNTNISQVEALYAPENNKFLNLGAQSSALFEWQSAKAEDNGVVLYDVAFDVEGGDFSKPIYVLPSDGKGFQRTLTMSFTALNKIAEMAGIPSKSSGKLQWTVWSSKGLDIKKSSVINTLVVERPGGFPTPDELFLTGTATEGGNDLSNAIPLKKTGPTTYELYTSLKPGEYQFISSKTGNGETFFINSSNLESGGSTTYTDDEKVYRIRIDFSDGSTTTSEIVKIELWFPPLGSCLFNLPYIGNGTWRAANKLIEFKEESWGRDERYKFKFTVRNSTGETDEWYGSINGDNQRPNDNTAEAYWYMVPVTDDYWSNSFKFNGGVDNQNADIDIIFNAAVPEYTHKVTVL
tara:strand:+ start:70 stop:1197 length:1128 start_codon:yes stop_codon:yes gene_type:complete